VTGVKVIDAVDDESDGVWSNEFAALSQKFMKPAH